MAYKRAVAALASGATLAGGGAAMLLAWQNGWWATLFGAALAVAWIAGLGAWTGVHAALHTAPSPPVAGRGDDPDAVPPSPLLHPLLDQVPVPLLRIDGAGAHAINRAARALFYTDDRILPPIPALGDRTADRLRHRGRSWRIDAVETAPGQRLAVLIDVDAEERAAERRAHDEMIDILGHELLNGLSPVVSLADSAITAAARGDAMLPDILATLARRVEGLEGFTRAYRTLSRLPDPVPATVPLADLAADLARLFAGRFGEAVALAVDAPDATARVDRDQLVQALWALLQNGAEAALAAPSPARVALTVLPGSGELAIRVSDTGAGIAAPDRARIFRPFFTTKPAGSGIGLTLARRIARAHGGDLHLLPTAATTFELCLPSHAGA